MEKVRVTRICIKSWREITALSLDDLCHLSRELMMSYVRRGRQDKTPGRDYLDSEAHTVQCQAFPFISEVTLMNS